VGELFCNSEYKINFRDIFPKSASKVDVIQFTRESFELGDGFTACFAFTSKRAPQHVTFLANRGGRVVRKSAFKEL
jgi:hypothetical protein